MSKIIRLTSENFKRLKAVEIAPDPDGNLVIVQGRNAQGKSSVLDSITAALGGTSSKDLPKPIRDGESKAQIVLETDELIVTRRFTPSGSTLTVTTPDGAKFPKAQAKLDELLGKLSLDPLAFTHLSERDQLKTLLGLVDLPIDPADLEADRKAAYDERTTVNREVKNLEAHAPHPGEFDGVPDEEVSVSALLDEHNAALAAARSLTAQKDEVDRLKEKVDRLERELAETLDLLEVEQNRLETMPLPADASQIKERIDSAEEINAKVREKRQAQAVLVDLNKKRSESDALTQRIKDIEQQKADMLAAAKFPVDGLGFDEAGVTYQGVPFKQASAAEQLRVSLAMAMALNPALRVIRIADGSLLDEDNLALVAEMATEHDFQVWIEMVGNAHEGGIVIEDGEVA